MFNSSVLNRNVFSPTEAPNPTADCETTQPIYGCCWNGQEATGWNQQGCLRKSFNEYLLPNHCFIINYSNISSIDHLLSPLSYNHQLGFGFINGINLAFASRLRKLVHLLALIFHSFCHTLLALHISRVSRLQITLRLS